MRRDTPPGWHSPRSNLGGRWAPWENAHEANWTAFPARSPIAQTLASAQSQNKSLQAMQWRDDRETKVRNRPPLSEEGVA